LFSDEATLVRRREAPQRQCSLLDQACKTQRGVTATKAATTIFTTKNSKNAKEDLPRQQEAKGSCCHFDRREKSFSDPSQSLRMTGRGLSLCELCVLARE
jgi:hypothetical protein